MLKSIYVYVDVLSKELVGSFIGENDILTKRFLLTTCYDALEKSRFNFGALKILCDRDVYKIEFNENEPKSFKKVFSMKELFNEAVAALKDRSRVIYVDDVQKEGE